MPLLSDLEHSSHDILGCSYCNLPTMLAFDVSRMKTSNLFSIDNKLSTVWAMQWLHVVYLFCSENQTTSFALLQVLRHCLVERSIRFPHVVTSSTWIAIVDRCAHLSKEEFMVLKENGALHCFLAYRVHIETLGNCESSDSSTGYVHKLPCTRIKKGRKI